MALGLSLICGYGGAEFRPDGLLRRRGLQRRVLSINLGYADGLTLFSLLLSAGISALFAAILGYFIFVSAVCSSASCP
ncbi:hypothetical protein [Paenirhodobacter sp.]|uniref:hypothetical protein n=1 Tax=Paenirhodobacter sp. TaxID=1965326 RepID=UPI003B40A1DC